MTVRRAVIADVPMLMDLARQEHGLSRFSHLPFDAVKSEMSFAQAITGLSTAVFVSDRGLIAGMVQPMLFNRFWNAYELLWFATDGQGMALLKALAAWAKGMRAVELVVHNYAGIVIEERFSKVMQRSGFSQLGAAYTKQLGEV